MYSMEEVEVGAVIDHATGVGVMVIDPNGPWLDARTLILEVQSSNPSTLRSLSFLVAAPRRAATRDCRAN